mgnify:CR=1 FL=1
MPYEIESTSATPRYEIESTSATPRRQESEPIYRPLPLCPTLHLVRPTCSRFLPTQDARLYEVERIEIYR